MCRCTRTRGRHTRRILLLVLIKRIRSYSVTAAFFSTDVASSPTLIISGFVSVVSLSPLSLDASALLHSRPRVCRAIVRAAMPPRKMYNTLHQCNGTVLFVSSCAVITRSRARGVCSGSVPQERRGVPPPPAEGDDDPVRESPIETLTGLFESLEPFGSGSF